MTNGHRDRSHTMKIIANRYEVVKTRAGGMGVVYLCLDRQEDRPVALKTFRPEYLSDRNARDRFLREGTIWTELGRHPYVVRAYRIEYRGRGRVEPKGDNLAQRGGPCQG